MNDTPVPTASTQIGAQASLETLRIVLDAASAGIAISGSDGRFRLVNQQFADFVGYEREELIGLSWRTLTHPDDPDGNDGLSAQASQMPLLHRSGRVAWASVTARAVPDSSTGETLTIAFVHETSPASGSEDVRRSLSDQTSLLASIVENSPLAVILTNEDGELTYLNESAQRLLNVPDALTALGRSVTRIDGGGENHACLLDVVKGQGRWIGERRFRPLDGGEELPVHVTAFRLQAQSGADWFAFMAKDIRERRKIEMALREREERMRRLARRLIAAQEQERGRIARELHDDITQRLAMIAMEIGFLQAEPESEPDILDAKLDTVRSQVVELTESVRNLSHQYHPSGLSHANLEAALEALCNEFENQHGIRARLHNRADTGVVSRPVAVAVYRIAQEALRNVARHSGAGLVVLTVDCEDNELRVSVLDDGKGFDAAAIRGRRGLGLTSMEERVVAIGGSIEFHSEPGAGVRIDVTAPLAAGCDEDGDGGTE